MDKFRELERRYNEILADINLDNLSEVDEEKLKDILPALDEIKNEANNVVADMILGASRTSNGKFASASTMEFDVSDIAKLTTAVDQLTDRIYEAEHAISMDKTRRLEAEYENLLNEALDGVDLNNLEEVGYVQLRNITDRLNTLSTMVSSAKESGELSDNVYDNSLMNNFADDYVDKIQGVIQTLNTEERLKTDQVSDRFRRIRDIHAQKDIIDNQIASLEGQILATRYTLAGPIASEELKADLQASIEDYNRRIDNLRNAIPTYDAEEQKLKDEIQILRNGGKLNREEELENTQGENLDAPEQTQTVNEPSEQVGEMAQSELHGEPIPAPVPRPIPTPGRKPTQTPNSNENVTRESTTVGEAIPLAEGTQTAIEEEERAKAMGAEAEGANSGAEASEENKEEEQNEVKPIIIYDPITGEKIMQRNPDGSEDYYDSFGGVTHVSAEEVAKRKAEEEAKKAAAEEDKKRNLPDWKPIKEKKHPLKALKDKVKGQFKKAKKWLKENWKRLVAGAVLVGSLGAIAIGLKGCEPEQTPTKDPTAITEQAQTEDQEEEVDISELQALIEEAHEVDPEKYTEESYEELMEQVDHAEKILEADDYTQETIDIEAEELEEALDNLVEKEIDKDNNKDKGSKPGNGGGDEDKGEPDASIPENDMPSEPEPEKDQPTDNPDQDEPEKDQPTDNPGQDEPEEDQPTDNPGEDEPEEDQPTDNPGEDEPEEDQPTDNPGEDEPEPEPELEPEDPNIPKEEPSEDKAYTQPVEGENVEIKNDDGTYIKIHGDTTYLTDDDGNVLGSMETPDNIYEGKVNIDGEILDKIDMDEFEKEADALKDSLQEPEVPTTGQETQISSEELDEIINKGEEASLDEQALAEAALSYLDELNALNENDLNSGGPKL